MANIFRRPIGYQDQGLSNVSSIIDPVLAVEKILALRQERERGAQAMQRERLEDRQKVLDEGKKARSETAESAVREVFGVPFAATPSIHPYAGPAVERFMKATRIPIPVKPMANAPIAREGGFNVIDSPMRREDLVRELRGEPVYLPATGDFPAYSKEPSGRARYDIDVKRAEPFLKESVETSGGKKVAQEPAESVTGMARVFPIAPERLRAETTATAQSYKEQLGLRGEREAYDTRLAREKAQTSEAESRAEIAAEDVRNIPYRTRILADEAKISAYRAGRGLEIDQAIKNLQLESAQLDRDIKRQFGKPTAQAELDAALQKQKYYQLQLRDLEDQRQRESAFNEIWPKAVASGDVNKMIQAMEKLGSKTAPDMITNIIQRGNTARAQLAEIGRLHKEVTENLIGLERGKDIEARTESLRISVDQMNVLQREFAKVANMDKVKVYSLYTPVLGEKPLLGSIVVPSEFADRAARGQVNMVNAKEVALLIATRAAGALYSGDTSVAVSAIEAVGRDLKIPLAILEVVKQQYLQQRNAATKPIVNPQLPMVMP